MTDAVPTARELQDRYKSGTGLPTTISRELFDAGYGRYSIYAAIKEFNRQLQTDFGGSLDAMAASPFNQPVPAGAARTVSQVLGEIVWLMSHSPLHKQFFISDLEWLVMPPVLLGQFRMYYDTGDEKNAPKPVGVVLWAEVDVDVRLSAGGARLRPQDWRSADRLWAVEVLAPFGGAEAMVKELKANVFPARKVRYSVGTHLSKA